MKLFALLSLSLLLVLSQAKPSHRSIARRALEEEQKEWAVDEEAVEREEKEESSFIVDDMDSEEEEDPDFVPDEEEEEEESEEFDTVEESESSSSSSSSSMSSSDEDRLMDSDETTESASAELFGPDEQEEEEEQEEVLPPKLSRKRRHSSHEGHNHNDDGDTMEEEEEEPVLPPKPVLPPESRRRRNVGGTMTEDSVTTINTGGPKNGETRAAEQEATARANYARVVKQLKKKFKNLREGCYPRPKGCECQEVFNDDTSPRHRYKKAEDIHKCYTTGEAPDLEDLSEESSEEPARRVRRGHDHNHDHDHDSDDHEHSHNHGQGSVKENKKRVHQELADLTAGYREGCFRNPSGGCTCNTDPEGEEGRFVYKGEEKYKCLTEEAALLLIF